MASGSSGQGPRLKNVTSAMNRRLTGNYRVSARNRTTVNRSTGEIKRRNRGTRRSSASYDIPF